MFLSLLQLSCNLQRQPARSGRDAAIVRRPASMCLPPTATPTAAPASADVGRSGLLRSLAAASLLLAAHGTWAPSADAATAAAGESAERVVASCAGSVVSVAAMASGKGGGGGLQQLGSGIVWDERGFIITSYAPLTKLQRTGVGEAQVFVTLTAADGTMQELPATILARDPSHELIVLQVEPPAAGLQAVRLGRSKDLRVGQDAVLLGALPGGGPILAAGVISALGRAIPASNNQPLAGAIQTDVDVTPQTLGGALFDSSGRLVGMPVISFSSRASVRSSGVNFALPADMLREVVPSLIVYRSAAVRR